MRFVTALAATTACFSSLCAAEIPHIPWRATHGVSTSSSAAVTAQSSLSSFTTSALSNATRSSLAISTPKWRNSNSSGPAPWPPYPMYNLTQPSSNSSNATVTVWSTRTIPISWTTLGGDDPEIVTSTSYTTVNSTATAMVYIVPIISVTTITGNGSVVVYTFTSAVSGASGAIGLQASPTSQSRPHTFSTRTKTADASEMTSSTTARRSKLTSTRKSTPPTTSSASRSSRSSEIDSSISATSSRSTSSFSSSSPPTSGTSSSAETSATSSQSSSASTSSSSTSTTSSTSKTSTTSPSASPKPTDKPEGEEEDDDRKDLIGGIVGGVGGFASLLGLSAAWWAHKSWSTAQIASDTLSSIGSDAFTDAFGSTPSIGSELSSVWSGVESSINSIASGLNLVESTVEERIADLRLLHGLVDPAQHLSSLLANAAQYRVTQALGTVLETFPGLDSGVQSQISKPPQFKLGDTLPLIEEDLPMLYETLGNALRSYNVPDSLGRSPTPNSYAERFANELRYATKWHSNLRNGYPAVDTMVINALEFLHSEQTSILSKVTPEASLDIVKMQERRWKTTEKVMDSIRDDGLFERLHPDLPDKFQYLTDDLLLNQLMSITTVVRGLIDEMVTSLNEYIKAALSHENQWEYVNHLLHQRNMVDDATKTMADFAENLDRANNPDLSRDEINKIAKNAVDQYRERFKEFMNENQPQPEVEDALYDPHEKYVDPKYQYPGERTVYGPEDAEYDGSPLETPGPSLYDPKAPPQTGAPNAPQGTAAPAANKPTITIVKGMDDAGFWTITHGRQPTSGPVETVTVYAQPSQARPTSGSSSGDTSGTPPALNSSTVPLQFAARAKTAPFWNPASPDVRCGSQQFQSIRLLNPRGFETPGVIAPISKDAMMSAVDTFANTSLSLWNGRTFTTSYGDAFQTVTFRGWWTPDKGKSTNAVARQMAADQGNFQGKAREIAMHIIDTCGPDGGQYSNVGFGQDRYYRPGGFGMEIFGSLACQLDGSCPNAVMHWPHWEPNEPVLEFTENDWKLCKAKGTCPNQFPDWNRLSWATLPGNSPFVGMWNKCHADGSCAAVRIPWEKMHIDWENVPQGSALREICKSDSKCRMH